MAFNDNNNMYDPNNQYNANYNPNNNQGYYQNPNQNMYYSNGYNQNGYNQNGYNQNGYNQNSYNPNGYNYPGTNPNGYNQNQNNGYNLNGYYTNAASNSEVVQKALTSSFTYMFAALLVTAITAFAVVNSGAWVTIFGTGAIWFFLIAEFAIVIGASAAIDNNNVIVSAILFVAYAIVNGVTLSSILLVYEIQSVSYIFLITAGIFGIMAFFGAVTKFDLSSLGGFFMMALFGIIIASLVNIFLLHSEGLDFAICVIGILIFVGLTAYDTQKIKKMAIQNSGYSIAVIGLWGALELYLDFINLFLKLLRLFGKRN